MECLSTDEASNISFVLWAGISYIEDFSSEDHKHNPNRLSVQLKKHHIICEYHYLYPVSKMSSWLPMVILFAIHLHYNHVKNTLNDTILFYIKCDSVAINRDESGFMFTR